MGCSWPLYAVGTHGELGPCPSDMSLPWGSPRHGEMPGGKHPRFEHIERLGHPGKELSDGWTRLRGFGADGCCQVEQALIRIPHRTAQAEEPEHPAHGDSARSNIWQGSFLMQFLNLDSPTAGKERWALTNTSPRVVMTAREKRARWETPT